MILKFKWLAILELLVIIILLAVLIVEYRASNKPDNAFEKQTTNSENNTIKLLSPRVYAGILEPNNLLIRNFDPLKKKLEEYMSQNNLNASIYVVNMRSGADFGINENDGFLPASLNKVPIAMLILKKVEKGKLSFDTMLPIDDSDRTDSFGDLYKTKEKELPMRVLFEKMLKESDNTAFRVLQRQVDPNEIKFLVKYLDYYSADITSDYPKNLSRETLEIVTPKSMYNLFSSLYLSSVLEPNDSEYILSLLTNTVFDIKKIAGLPDDVTVSQKFGFEDVDGQQYLHSCGIMYTGNARIFYCIMTYGLSQENGIQTIGFVVNLIHRYIADISEELFNYRERERATQFR